MMLQFVLIFKQILLNFILKYFLRKEKRGSLHKKCADFKLRKKVKNEQREKSVRTKDAVIYARAAFLDAAARIITAA